MAYFYVKNSLGTRTTGGGLTKQTGSFTSLGASNVYATITAAITDGAGSGDYICVSDAHSYSINAHIQYSGPSTGDFLYVVSVADANCDSYSKATAAQEATTSGVSIRYTGRLSFKGVYLKSNDNHHGYSANNLVKFDSCTLEMDSNGDLWQLTVDGVHWTLIDTEVKGAFDSYIWIGDGCFIEAYGGSFAWTTKLTDGRFWGSGFIYMDGVDLSSIATTLIANVGNDATQDDKIDVRLKGCKLNAGVSFTNETLENTNQRIAATNSSATSAAAEYQFYVEAYGGTAEDETSIYRTGSTPFPSGQQTSLKVVTDTNATPSAPFWFDFPTRYAVLSDTTSDQLRVYLTTNTQLYDSDLWIEAVYPDDTNKHTYNYQSTRHTDIMDTNGTELSTNTETWAGTAQTYRYHIDLDTAAGGSDGYPIIRMYCSKASTTIYVDSEVVTHGG